MAPLDIRQLQELKRQLEKDLLALIKGRVDEFEKLTGARTHAIYIDFVKSQPKEHDQPTYTLYDVDVELNVGTKR